MKKQDPYWFRVMVAGNLLLAAVFGAEMYETVCAAAWHNRAHQVRIVRWWARFTIWTMNLFHRNHCRISSRLHDRLMRKPPEPEVRQA